MQAAKFTDPGKELATLGFIVSGRLNEIPPAARIPAQAFTDQVCRIVYEVAEVLDATGRPVCLESINDWCARNGLSKDIQAAIDSTNTISWQRWSENLDMSLAWCPPAPSPDQAPGPIAYCLSELAHLYQRREEYRLKKQWFEETISDEDFKGAWQRLHQNNGAIPFDRAPYDERRFSEDRLHEKPIPLFSLCGQSIATLGNICALYAQAKAGKSAVISALMATVMAEDETGDFLGFNAAYNPEGRAVVHFDTEQSRYDHEQVVLRAVRRAGCNKTPTWLRSYCLTDLDISTRRAFISKELEHATKEHGGVFCMLIDGIGDFVPDVNDIASTHALIVELHGLAMKYNTVLLLVLHENPGIGKMAIEKMRGHLGSQLERKAESNIRIAREPNGSCVIYTEKSRHANIPKEKGHRFAWNETAQSHTTVPPGEEPITEEDREAVRDVFDCPENVGGLTYTLTIGRLMAVEHLTHAGAKKRLAKYKRLKLIVRNPNAKELYIENQP